MTRLHELYNVDKEAFNAELQAMDTEQLFAELDDTIQFDILKVSNETWTTKMQSEKKVYNLLMRELRERVKN